MCSIITFANHFGLKQYYISEHSINHNINIPEVDRPGLELTGFFEHHQKDRLILLGKKELTYINSLEYEQAYKVMLELCNEEVPGIVVCHDLECPKAVMDAAIKNDVAVFGTEIDTSVFEADALYYLSEVLAKKTSLHANLLQIFGQGCLLIGPSGIGKSEISLELIRKGHCLVADDRVDIADVRGKLIGTCPETIYGMMEVRGIGIINVSRMFGVNSLTKRSHIRLLINLVPFNTEIPLERIGMKTDHYEILNESIPLIRLPVSAARSMAEIIETAVTNFKLKDDGYDTGYEFQKRLLEIQERRLEEKREQEKFVKAVTHIQERDAKKNSDKGE